MHRGSYSGSPRLFRLFSLALAASLIAIQTMTTPLVSSSAASAFFFQEGQAPFQGSPHAVPGAIQCEDFDDGGQGVAYSDKNPSNDGNQYRTTGVDISVCSEGGFEVGSVFAGEWLEYTIEIATAGSYTVEARVASAGAGGAFHIEFDGVNKTGSVNVPNTGAWSSYRTAAKSSVSLSAGRQVMRVAMDGNGQTGAVGNFNYIRILSLGPPAPQFPFTDTPKVVVGKIESEDFDRGGEEVAFHDIDEMNKGGQYRASGVDITACSEGGFEVSDVFAEEWLEYTIDVASAGNYVIEARAASNGPGGTFHVEFDGQDKTGIMSIPDTGGWNRYKTVFKMGVRLNAGRQVMRVAMDGNGPSGAVANFNYFRIAESTDAMDTNPAMVGQWIVRRDMPAVAIHMHLLPNGKVLFWQSDDRSLVTQARVWDIEANSFTTVTNTNTNVFCSGHSFLPDGRLLVAGGHHLESSKGEPHTNIFDYRTNTWSRGPDMNAGRWYPSNCTLANGDVLVVSGTDENLQFNNLPQVWEGNGWRSLTGAVHWLPYYPWMALAPDGRVFCAGPDQATGFLDTRGTGEWTPGPESSYGYRDYGSFVMYDAGKILIVGGGTPTNAAEVIDLNQPSPSWRRVSSMYYARRQLNTVVLPDGKVLAIGGTSGGGFNSFTGTERSAEMWDPSNDVWTMMATQQVERLYHSTAMLLPDARVLVAGGGQPGPTGGGGDNYNLEIYSPPYLFKGSRPTITSVQDAIAYGERFQVKVPDKKAVKTVSDVVLIRLPSVTHAITMDQRRVRLSFAKKGKNLEVSAPANGNIAPPGYYMLFLVNKQGVPSVAKIIKVG
ncbi:MAG TPA: carbohydrate-binding protein [Blastocatellia bacterium]|nr:carbohydrate-binding protein [Blastocatellia bacterium]